MDDISLTMDTILKAQSTKSSITMPGRSITVIAISGRVSCNVSKTRGRGSLKGDASSGIGVVARAVSSVDRTSLG